MCGIVGYIGNKQAAPILLDGLSKLEYRGYDSSGIAVFDDKKINIIKSTGKLENLYKKTHDGNSLDGTLGIGHTRWATHGKPTLENAHPHYSKHFTIVHNGIIENEKELKNKYLKDTKFYSQTDTEVIVELFEKFYESEKDIKNIINRLIEELKGSYALAILNRENPETIYAVKNQSPLIIGKGNDFNMLASDAVAMVFLTDEFYEIKDKEYAIITKNSIEIFSQTGEKINRNSYTAQFELTDTEKGAYSHYMLKEIEEQPIVIRRILEKYQNTEGMLEIDDKISDSIKNCDKLYIIACGTSYHAGLVAKQFFEQIAKKPTEVVIASEFTCHTQLLSNKPMFIFISQSGETADCRSVLVKVKKSGYKTLTITNVKNSTLAREADHSLLLWAGPEIAVASTKAYIAQVTLLAILATVVNNSIKIDIKNELFKISLEIEEICSKKEMFEKFAKEFLKDKKHCFYIGRGIDYYVCLEAALKLKEISYIHTEGFSAGELKHGTIALIENNTPVIAINTQDELNSYIRSNIQEVKARGANVLTICKKSLKTSDDQIIINDVHNILTPLLSVVPAQYLAYYAALQNDCDIDKPRNLAKSVTVE